MSSNFQLKEYRKQIFYLVIAQWLSSYKCSLAFSSSNSNHSSATVSVPQTQIIYPSPSAKCLPLVARSNRRCDTKEPGLAYSSGRKTHVWGYPPADNTKWKLIAPQINFTWAAQITILPDAELPHLPLPEPLKPWLWVKWCLDAPIIYHHSRLSPQNFRGW